MKAPTTFASLAGPSALVDAAALLPFWYIHLFVATPIGLEPMRAAMAQLKFDASAEDRVRILLVMWALAPIGWVMVGVLLLSLKIRSKSAARLLLAGSVALAITSAALVGWEAIILFGAPVWLSAIRLKPSL